MLITIPVFFIELYTKKGRGLINKLLFVLKISKYSIYFCASIQNRLINYHPKT